MCAGVGDALSCDVWGSTARGFIQSKWEAELVLFRAEAGRCQHAEGATDNTHLVRQDIAEHIFSEQHVELVWVACELHRGVVDIHVAELDLRCVLGEVCGDDFSPKDRRFEHVGLVDGADAVATCFSGVDGDLGNALDFAGLVNHRVDRLLFAIFKCGGGLWLTKIDATGELADADDIDAVGDAVVFEWRGFSQLWIKQAWAHIGVKRECLTNRQ